MIIDASASAVAAPPMSFFIFSMPLSGLISRPPVSKQTPLPTSVTRGCLSSPHVMSISRGAPVAARPTAWISGKFLSNSSSPTTALMVAEWRAASLRAACSSCAGPMSFAGVLIRSRASVTASTMRSKVVAVEALRQIELDRARLGLAITSEMIEAERDSKRGKPRIVRLVGEAIGALRQEAAPAGRGETGLACRPALPARTARRRAQPCRSCPAAEDSGLPWARIPRPRRKPKAPAPKTFRTSA